ncbi:hypothetical protein GF351_04225 [Candidatus Woesearchaeota archaeon]|nr:hypothetical protein [Candidatus Woesearchaeota archaeon]
MKRKGKDGINSRGKKPGKAGMADKTRDDSVAKRMMEWFRNTAFYSSFKDIDMRFLLVMAFEACFVLISSVMVKLWAFSIEQKGLQVMGIDLGNVLSTAPGAADSYLSSIKEFIMYSVASMFVVFLALLLLWCLYNALVWTTILRKRLTFSYYVFFVCLHFPLALLTLIIGLPLMLMVMFLMFVMQPLAQTPALGYFVALPAIILVIGPLMYYVWAFVTYAYYLFTQRFYDYRSAKKLKDIRFSFSEVMHKIGQLYVAFVVMELVFFAIFHLYYLLDLLPKVLGMVLGFALLLAYSAWIRFYFKQVIER